MTRISDALITSIMADTFDAHLDQPGEPSVDGQGGWWGSAEQLGDMNQLGGAARVIFMESADGTEVQPPGEFLATAQDILDRRFPRQMPQSWKHGQQYALHVEALEAYPRLPGIGPIPTPRELYQELHRLGVRSCTPIYHNNNVYGGCSKESGKGLNPNIAPRMYNDLFLDLGWKVCMAHMSMLSMQETIEYFLQHGIGERLSYTHGCIRWDNPRPEFVGNAERMISFATAYAVIKAGGLVGISPAEPFYDEPDRYFADLMRLIEISGGNGVAIGTDAGGLLDEWLFPGWNNVANMFRQTIIGLLERDVPEEIVRKVAGQNARKFFMR